MCDGEKRRWKKERERERDKTVAIEIIFTIKATFWLPSGDEVEPLSRSLPSGRLILAENIYDPGAVAHEAAREKRGRTLDHDSPEECGRDTRGSRSNHDGE